MYYSPFVPLTLESKIENKQYYIVHPFYNGNVIGIDIGDFILSYNNSILVVTEVLYNDHPSYVFYRCTDILHGGSIIILETRKSIILKGFIKDDLIDILKIINYTLNVELVTRHNNLESFSNSIINSKVLTNLSSQYITAQMGHDIDKPLYVVEVYDNGYMLFNNNYLLMVGDNLKIKNKLSYFNFIISLIDSHKYTDKNTISNIEMNITEYFLNKKVIDLYGL